MIRQPLNEALIKYRDAAARCRAAGREERWPGSQIVDGGSCMMEGKHRKQEKMTRQRASRIGAVVLSFFLVIGFLGEASCKVCAKEQAKGEEEVGELYARSAVLMDADSGRVLVSKDGDTMRPMASTTKILTCILALEEGNLKDVVTASEEAASQPKVHLGMQNGEKFYLEDLLYSLMLESHNDTAYAIAEHLAGSVSQFAERMNEKAKEIGCTNAHFVTPNGLDGSDEGGVHSISAADLALIMSYCVAKSPKTEEFLKITQADSYSFHDVDGTRQFTCNNHNLFLSMMDGAISGKTGFTGDAGYCYVGALKSEGRTFVVSLLACGWPNNKNYKWADTKALMRYGIDHYHYRNVWQEPQMQKIPVQDGITESGSLFELVQTGVKIEADEKELMLLLSDDEEIRVEAEQENALAAPVMKGQKVGEIRYFLNDELVKEYDLVTDRGVEEKHFFWVLDKIFNKYVQCRLWQTGEQR